MTFRKIINGLVFHEDGSFTPDTVYICGEKIVLQEVYEKECSTASGNEMVTDAAGNYVIPGLTDIHFHGCMGSDCCDGTVEAFQTIARYELSQGITSITPATMTMSEEVLSSICRAAKTYRDSADENAADFCGLYMEGPLSMLPRKARRTKNTLRLRTLPC